MKLEYRKMLFLLLLCICFVFCSGSATAESITVDSYGSGNYVSIQEAIDNANSGDFIIVSPGTYTENLLVDKSVSIVSESGYPDDTTILSAIADADVIHVTADNVTICGFNITRSDMSYEEEEYPEYVYSGIFADKANNCLIINNSLSHNYRGVYLEVSNNNMLDNNIIHSNGAAIGIDGSSYNILINNHASLNSAGISVFGSNNTVVFNNIESCEYAGITIYGSNTTVKANTIKHCDTGISVGSTADYSVFANNNVLSNNYGFYLFYSYYTTISENNVADNSQSGFFIRNSLYNTLNGNTISNNSEYGMQFEYYAHSNLIYDNYFNNTNNAKDGYSNTWSLIQTEGTNVVGGPYLDGNFWANPNGTGFSQTSSDTNDDGICDASYTIEGSSVDKLPLSLYQYPVPTASILWIYPDYLYNDGTVLFYGKGNSLVSPIVAYNWTSSMDGHLSDSANFSASDLSVGVHTIYFSVQNAAGAWSDEVSSLLIVDAHRPVLNTTFESQLGGLMTNVFISGDYAYVLQGQSLVVVDTSNTSEPSEVGRLALPSEIQDVVIEGNYAYIADGESGLVIVDIEDPSAPLLTSVFPTDCFAYGLDISGNYAFIAADGTIVVDISDPASPAHVHGLYYSGGAQAIAVKDNYAYVSQNNLGLFVFDIGNPSSLSYLGSYGYDSWVWDICISGDYAYVATDSAGLQIFNISNQSSPEFVSKYDTYDCIMGVDVVGNLTYMAAADDSLIILDVSDPSQPQLKTGYPGVFGTDITVSDNYAYLTTFDDGLLVIDMSDPADPTFTGNYHTIDFVSDIFVNDNFAFCIPILQDGLDVIDISAPNSPAFLGTYTGANLTDVAVTDNYAYLIDNESGLLIADIGDPVAPAIVGSYYADSLRNVAVLGNYAYTLSDSSLAIIDVEDPICPSLAGIYPGVQANSVSVYGSYAYLATLEGDLVIIDVSDPTAPSLAGIYDSGNILGVAVSGNYVYLADYDAGLVIIDVSKPANPSYIYTYSTLRPQDVAINGDYLYVASGDESVIIFDISTPWLPSMVNSYDTAGSASGVAVVDSHVYVADGQNGLVVLSIDNLPLSVSTPNASIISISPNPGCYGDPVTFDGVGISSTGSIIAYNWRSNIDGQLSTSASFTSSSLSVGNHTIYFKVRDDDGNWSEEVSSNLVIDEISYSSDASDSTSSSGGGGGGGGGGTTGELYGNIAFKDVRTELVQKDDVTSYDFEDNNNEVEYIQFTASRNWGKITATIECLHDTSALVDKEPNGIVYRNLNIWVGKSGFSDPGNIRDCVIGFKVSRSWLLENGFDESAIGLLHYSGGEWEELETKLVDEDETYLHFEANTPGFSPFAIVAYPEEEVVEDADIKMSFESTNDQGISAKDNTTESQPKTTPAFEGMMGVLSVLLAGYFMVLRKRS